VRDGILIRGATLWAGAAPAPRDGWLLVRDGQVAAHPCRATSWPVSATATSSPTSP